MIDIMAEAVAFRGLSKAQHNYFSEKLKVLEEKNKLINRLEDLSREQLILINDLIKALEKITK